MKKFIPQLLLVITLAITSLLGCSSKSALTIDAAYDLQSPVSREVLPDYISSSINFSETKIEYSSDPIQSLKDGACDMVLLGSDPQPGELDGLDYTVIAYDAVCILVDYNSWLGGEYWTHTAYIDTVLPPSASAIPAWGWNPECKMAGLSNLTMDDLKGIFNNNSKGNTEKWTYPFYTWGSLTDLDTGEQSIFDQWLLKPMQIAPALQLKPGIFDTQTVLYDALGLPQPQATTLFKSEESALETLYGNAATSIGKEPFDPIISFASRMATQTALQHIGVAVVSINGINPVTDTEAVYNGTYPLSRKIYLVTRKDVSPATQAFENYLLSADGQNALASAGLLPLQESTNSSGNLTSAGVK